MLIIPENMKFPAPHFNLSVDNFNIFFPYTCVLYYSCQKDERAKPGNLLINFLPLTLLDEDSVFEVLTCLRRLVAGLSTRRPGFESRPLLSRIVVNKMALGHVFPSTTVFSGIIPPQLHTHLHLHVAVTGSAVW